MLLAVFQQIFEASDPCQLTRSVEPMKHSLFSLLVSLKDKEITSRNLSLLMYFYMELTRTRLTVDLLNVLLKANGFFRSRLRAFAMRNTCKIAEEMMRNPPIFPETDKTGGPASHRERAVGLLSFVTGSPVHRFHVALNLSYLSLLHNKDEGETLHGYLKMFNKIIQEEQKLCEINEENFGNHKKNPDSYKAHEYSEQYLIHYGDRIVKFLEVTDESNSAITAVGLPALCRRKTTDFATTKASAAEMQEGPFREGTMNVFKCYRND